MIKKDTTPFTQEEYEKRIASVIATMAERGVDTLVVMDAADIIYLTGYLGDSAYVAQAFVLTNNGDAKLYLRDMDVAGAWHTSWLPCDSVIGYPEHLIGCKDGADGYGFILDRLPAAGGIGLALDSMPHRIAKRFEEALGEDRLKNMTDVVAWKRLIKSAAEVQAVREGAQIASLGAAKAGEVIRSGVRECDAAAEITAALIRGTSDFGGTDVTGPLLPSGTKIGTAHLTWTEQPFERNTSVNLELGGVRYGYCGAIMRTISIGKPSDRLLSLHDATVEGFDRAFEVAKPGALCEDIAAAFRPVVERAGFTKASRCGYPIGIHWLEPTASLRDGDKTVMQPGMTFHFMLGMWVERDFGCTFSETVAITETGAEVLTDAPREILIVE